MCGTDEPEHVVGLAVDHADPPVAEIDQVLGGEPADLDVVDAEARDRVVVVADVDDLHPLVVQPADLVVGERHVDADQPVDAAIDRPGDLEHVATLALGADADDDRVVSRLGEHRLDAGDDVREVPAVEQRHGHGDRPRAAGGEPGGGGIGAVVELGRDLLDPLTRGTGDVRQAAQGPADRRHGHPGRSRDVFDRRALAAHLGGVRWHVAGSSGCSM